MFPSHTVDPNSLLAPPPSTLQKPKLVDMLNSRDMDGFRACVASLVDEVAGTHAATWMPARLALAEDLTKLSAAELAAHPPLQCLSRGHGLLRNIEQIGMWGSLCIMAGKGGFTASSSLAAAQVFSTAFASCFLLLFSPSW